MMGPLDAPWCTNQQMHNSIVYEAAALYPEIIPVPVIDPTLPTWREALRVGLAQPILPVVKLVPSYSPYKLDAAHELCAAASNHDIAILVQTRMDDPRHQHPLVAVPDTPFEDILDLARRCPAATIIAGGPRYGDLQSNCDSILSIPNLHADTSQVDGMNALVDLCARGLESRLLFGTHAPLFTPRAALARVLVDLEEGPVRNILGGNAKRLLKGL